MSIKKSIGVGMFLAPIISILMAACLIEPWILAGFAGWLFMMIGLYLAGELED